jgi:hypothetical protein
MAQIYQFPKRKALPRSERPAAAPEVGEATLSELLLGWKDDLDGAKKDTTVKLYSDAVEELERSMASRGQPPVLSGISKSVINACLRDLASRP